MIYTFLRRRIFSSKTDAKMEDFVCDFATTLALLKKTHRSGNLKLCVYESLSGISFWQRKYFIVLILVPKMGVSLSPHSSPSRSRVQQPEQQSPSIKPPSLPYAIQHRPVSGHCSVPGNSSCFSSKLVFLSNIIYTTGLKTRVQWSPSLVTATRL